MTNKIYPGDLVRPNRGVVRDVDVFVQLYSRARTEQSLSGVVTFKRKLYATYLTLEDVATVIAIENEDMYVIGPRGSGWAWSGLMTKA